MSGLTPEREAEIRDYAAKLNPAHPLHIALAEINHLRELLDAFDGSPEDFIEGYKEMEAENNRLRGEVERLTAEGKANFTAAASGDVAEALLLRKLDAALAERDKARAEVERLTDARARCGS